MAELNQDAIDVLNEPTPGTLPGEPLALSDDDIATDIATIVSNLDQLERSTRDQMIKLWKYLELLWSGAGNFYWDHLSGQWRAITQEDIALVAKTADIDATMVNKTINLIRPYGESLAGVLTTGLPRVRYFPDDANKHEDIIASKAYTTVEEKIANDNMMTLRMIEILVKLWNGGFVAVYNYTHESKSYGVDEEPVIEDKMFDQESLVCTECGTESPGQSEMVPEETSENEGSIDLDEEVTTDDPGKGTDLSITEELEPEYDMPQAVPYNCPTCGTDTMHLSTIEQTMEPIQTGIKEIPKCREIINVYGPMNVKISSLATKKEHLYWLILEEELDVALTKSLYPKYKDKITGSNGNANLDTDRQARSQFDFGNDAVTQAATIRKVWLKPSAFEHLTDEDHIGVFRKTFPNGLMAEFCGDTFLTAKPDDMDDHWSISINPLYPRVMADPVGKALIGPHEMANDLLQLENDSVRYGIPRMFADPAYFDFNADSQTRALPGSVSPMKRPPGGKLQDVIAEAGKATLPNGIEYLDSKVEKLMQFISGILPPIFGGTGAGSKTLGEYQESKNQALQRLALIWKIVSVLYSDVMSKATKQYVKALKKRGKDERFVKENGKDNFLNVWIRKSDFEGKVGDVRPELSEQFPLSWAQKSAKLMELLQLNNDMILQWFMHPENVELVYQAIGITDMYIPGEDQRNKQLCEIGEMLAAPTEMEDPMTGMPMPVQPIPYPISEIDDDMVHSQVTAAFLNSTIGIELQKSDPMKYEIIKEHFMQHIARLQVAQQAQAEAEAKAGANKSEKVNDASAQ